MQQERQFGEAAIASLRQIICEIFAPLAGQRQFRIGGILPPSS
jgi:hypothetical protein